ncbi:MAG: hypothetical protein QXP06_07340, partial [Candidatus Bathyarchaeia archaeon]
KKLWGIYTWLRLKPVKARYPLGTIYLLSLFGGFSHIFLDMFTHPEMLWVLYPFANGNPYYLWQASIMVEVAVVVLSLYSLRCWLKN